MARQPAETIANFNTMSFAAIAIATTAVSTGLSIYGQRQADKAASSAASANNAIAEAEARNMEVTTAEAVKRERLNNDSALSALRNRMTGSGFLTTSGSSLLLEAEAAGRLEVGIADAVRSAKMKADSLRSQGVMGLWEAKMSSKASKINMAATAIKGIGSAVSGYKLDKSIGMYPRIGTPKFP